MRLVLRFSYYISGLVNQYQSLYTERDQSLHIHHTNAGNIEVG